MQGLPEAVHIYRIQVCAEMGLKFRSMQTGLGWVGLSPPSPWARKPLVPSKPAGQGGT